MPQRKPAQAKPEKPKKPPGFPLTAHPNGQWSKKFKGRPHYFGPWGDPDEALENFNHDWPFITKGETPPPRREGGVTIHDICNSYIDERKRHADSGHLKLATWGQYRDVAVFIVNHWGRKRPATSIGKQDFAKLRTAALEKWGSRVDFFVRVTKMIFRYAVDPLELLPHEPVYGRGFKGPSKSQRRAEKNERGPLLYDAEQVKAMLCACNVPMKAMTLLGLNGGFGNTDCATLPISAIDFDKAFIDYPRPKTHIPRRVPLWPETVEALKAALASRPSPNNPKDADLVFVTKYGNPWIVEDESKDEDGATVAVRTEDAITKEYAKLLRKLKVHRKGLGFYSLRRTFRTYADEAGDIPAINLIMGHTSDSMGDHYVQRIEDARLKKVVDLVRDSLKIAEASQPAAEPSAVAAQAEAEETSAA